MSDGPAQEKWEELPDDVAYERLHRSSVQALRQMATLLTEAHEAIDQHNFVAAMDALLAVNQHLNSAGMFATAGAARWQPAALTHRQDQATAGIRDFMEHMGITDIFVVDPSG